MQLTPHGLMILLRYKDARNPTEAELGIRKRFLEIFPETEAAVISYQENGSTCKCAGEILQAMVKDGYAKLKANVSHIVGEPVELMLPRALAGEVHTFANEDGYKQAMRENQQFGHMFRGLSVIHDTDAAGTKVIKVYYW